MVQIVKSSGFPPVYNADTSSSRIQPWMLKCLQAEHKGNLAKATFCWKERVWLAFQKVAPASSWEFPLDAIKEKNRLAGSGWCCIPPSSQYLKQHLMLMLKLSETGRLC